MEAFISRKKRRLDEIDKNHRRHEVFGAAEAAESESVANGSDGEDDTDVKLATLASLHHEIDASILLDALISSNGSVPAASRALLFLCGSATSPQPAVASPPPKPKVIGYQSSFLAYTTPMTSNGGSNAGAARPAQATKPRRPLTKKGQTLHLYSPADIAAHTPCTIVHNFLPQAQASALLLELLTEAQTFSRQTFKLFERQVTSPHSACFFVEDEEERRKIGTEYLYNGSYLTDIRQLTPQMRAVSGAVADAVNEAVAGRIRSSYPGARKLRFQSPRKWRPNAAFVNCYDGGKQSVGYHSDQLTYLGPRAVIGSVSLGVAREFRVRRVVAKDAAGGSGGGGGSGEGDREDSGEAVTRKRKEEAEEKEEEVEDHDSGSGGANSNPTSTTTTTAADEQGQIAIHLPHNSLLVMHAEMQEEWKHSIAPAAAIDPHPLAGNRRINITYRHYREEFHPRYTPRCRCAAPCVLRCVRRRSRSRSGRYAWMCDVGQRVAPPASKGCAFFERAVFDDDGDPPWIGDVRGKEGGHGRGKEGGHVRGEDGN